jgi:predicted DNA-binding protein with PD1-like motif
MKYSQGKTGRVFVLRLEDGEVKVWKVAEVVIIELLGVNARREVDAKTGFELLVPRRPSMTDLTRHAMER